MMNNKEANTLGHRLYQLLEAIAYGKVKDKEIHALLDLVLETKPRNFRTMMTTSRENRKELEVVGFIEFG